MNALNVSRYLEVFNFSHKCKTRRLDFPALLDTRLLYFYKY
jgi:hypothetical protein